MKISFAKLRIIPMSSARRVDARAFVTFVRKKGGGETLIADRLGIVRETFTFQFWSR